MTTIALDENTIAADRQLTIDAETCAVYGGPKILEKDGYVFAVCGAPVIQEAVKWFLEAGGDYDSNLLPGGIWELLVWDGETWHSWDSEVRTPVAFEVPMAVGSGAKFAMGALIAGKNAVKAVEVASILDPFTGMGVEKIRYRKR